MVRSAALIGTGAMGAPMAWRLHAAGVQLTVFDRSEESVQPFRDRGVKVASSPAECAGSDVVLVLVNNAQQVEDVVRGDGGVLDGAGEARSPLVAIMSTVSAELVRDLGSALMERGIRVVDAPVSGGEARAQEGTLTIMVGGRPEDFQDVRDLFGILGNHVFHCGPLGTGETIKLLNNVIGTMNALVGAEVYRLAVESGIRTETLTDVLEVSTGRSFLTADSSVVRGQYERYSRNRPDFDRALALYRKDTVLAAAIASSSDGRYPCIAALADVLGSLGDESFENWRAVADAAGRPSDG